LNLIKELNKLEIEYNSMKFEREHEIGHYFSLRQQIESLRNQMASIISQPKNILNFLNPGRLIHVVNKNDNYGWGVVLNFRKRPGNKVNINLNHTAFLVILIIKSSFWLTKERSRPNVYNRYAFIRDQRECQIGLSIRN
jgi:ATP-dependent RNA helicase DOB1